ncbi:unnamed protein product [Closterium sp. Naga37s-1]|nr:unnamed protein product [Closterium sp. Naga37s-1]
MIISDVIGRKRHLNAAAEIPSTTISAESADSLAASHGASLASLDSPNDVNFQEEFTGDSEEKTSTLAISPAVSAAVAEAQKLYGSKAAAIVADLAPSLVSAASPAAIDAHIRACVFDGLDSAFYVMDAGVALQLHATWTQLLPRVHPFYAVKCNPDPALLSLLASVGAGFDVASKAEMEMVAAACGGSLPDPSRIIYANPCKLPAHIRFAAVAGVNMTTFDSVTELQKLRRWNPSAQAVLRVRVDDPGARCPMGVKYGAEAEECPELLAAAQELGVEVVGVAFHVGSGAKDARILGDAIMLARDVFNVAEQLGMAPLSLLDIGGGFTYDGLQDDDYASAGGGAEGAEDGGADGEMSFLKACYSVNVALAKYFPEEMGVRVIAEPGRFFAEAPFTLATKVFGVRSRRTTASKAAALAALTEHASSSSGNASAGECAVMEYWIDDGIYGSMNCLLYDHAVISARPVKMAAEGQDAAEEEGQLCRSTVFGPTCDGLDTILRDVWLPRLDLDDWLVFPKMGAYTQAAGSSFNGFVTSDIGIVRVFSSAFPKRLAEAAACLHDRVADALSFSDSDAMVRTAILVAAAHWKTEVKEEQAAAGLEQFNWQEIGRGVRRGGVRGRGVRRGAVKGRGGGEGGGGGGASSRPRAEPPVLPSLSSFSFLLMLNPPPCSFCPVPLSFPPLLLPPSFPLSQPTAPPCSHPSPCPHSSLFPHYRRCFSCSFPPFLNPSFSSLTSLPEAGLGATVASGSLPPSLHHQSSSPPLPPSLLSPVTVQTFPPSPSLLPSVSVPPSPTIHPLPYPCPFKASPDS